MRAGYLSAGGESFFVALQEPSATSAGLAAVLVPPFGWDETASYRVRYDWAASLAEAGISAARIDLPGTGDSAAGPRAPGRLEAWTAAVATTADWLRDESGAGRVAVAGIGLGALIAVLAAQRTRVDDLVLWGTPSTGRAFVRELKAFARLEADQLAGPPGDEGIHAGGFLLAAATAAELGAVDLRTAGPLSARRALLLGRDETAPDQRLLDALAGQGVDVDARQGPGWALMHDVPHRALTPVETFGEICEWLLRDASAGIVPARPSLAPELVLDGARESIVELPHDRGSLFGVLTRPDDVRRPGCAVLLNAGAIRRSGPSRMWVEAARRWARAGLPTLRVDVAGVGDGRGAPAQDADVRLYAPHYVDQVRAVLDGLEQRGIGPPFFLAGLCSGAYWAAHAALDDPRVEVAVLLNSRLLVWDPAILEARGMRAAARVPSARSWGRLLTGRVGVRHVARRVRGLVRALPQALRDEPLPVEDLGEVVERIALSDARFVFSFSGAEPLREELEAGGMLQRFQDLPNVELSALPGSDHTLRPWAAQQAAHAVLDAAILA